MTAKSEIDAAINACMPSLPSLKTRLRLGPSASRAFAAEAVADGLLTPGQAEGLYERGGIYRGVKVEPTTDFDGWELRG